MNLASRRVANCRDNTSIDEIGMLAVGLSAMGAGEGHAAPPSLAGMLLRIRQRGSRCTFATLRGNVLHVKWTRRLLRQRKGIYAAAFPIRFVAPNRLAMMPNAKARGAVS